MVPLLIHLIKLTKWPRLPSPTVRRIARRDRLARSPKELSKRDLRKRVFQRCLNELSEREASLAERVRDEGILDEHEVRCWREFFVIRIDALSRGTKIDPRVEKCTPWVEKCTPRRLQVVAAC